MTTSTTYRLCSFVRIAARAVLVLALLMFVVSLFGGIQTGIVGFIMLFLVGAPAGGAYVRATEYCRAQERRDSDPRSSPWTDQSAI